MWFKSKDFMDAAQEHERRRKSHVEIKRLKDDVYQAFLPLYIADKESTEELRIKFNKLVDAYEAEIKGLMK